MSEYSRETLRTMFETTTITTNETKTKVMNPAVLSIHVGRNLRFQKGLPRGAAGNATGNGMVTSSWHPGHGNVSPDLLCPTFKLRWQCGHENRRRFSDAVDMKDTKVVGY